MKIKIFGKELFEVASSKADFFIHESRRSREESKFLPDFHTRQDDFSNMVAIEDSNGDLRAVEIKKEENLKEEKVELTPKGVYEMKLLNDESFKINVSDEYVDENIEAFKDKLGMIKATEFDMRRGVNEVSSILARFENRKRYVEFKDFYEQFPYTTTSKINAVVKSQDHLKLGSIAQFIADMPKEAVDVMKEYDKKTKQLCGKQAVYYLIADKKDFKKTDDRKDPILLAQSPFGHFWQILGAWDKEMLLLEEL